MKYLASFRTTLKASRYMFRALALVLWLLIAFSSVFYIVNALHQRESEIRQEFNLSSDQAQRFIQRTSDVMKELKYIAENRLSAENGVLSPRGRETQTDVPAFEPLFADSDCSAMSNTWRGSLESLAWFMRYWRDNFSAAYDLNRVFLIGSDNLCMANFGLRDMPVERDTALKALHERINKYRNAPQDDSGSNLYWISEGPRPGVGYFYALTPVYLANRLQALLGVEQTIRMENFFLPGTLPMGVTILDENGHTLISLTGPESKIKGDPRWMQERSWFGYTEGFRELVLKKNLPPSSLSIVYSVPVDKVLERIRMLILNAILLNVLAGAALFTLARMYERRIFIPAESDALRLEEHEQFNRKIVASAPVGICILRTADGVNILSNELAHTYLNMLTHEDRQRLTQIICGQQVNFVDVLTSNNTNLQISFVHSRYRNENVAICVLVDVSSRVKMEESLQEMAQAAEQASQSKSMFLATVSHELRTPLYGIIGNLDLLQTKELPKGVDRLVTAMNNSSSLLLKIISDILDFSKIESEQLKIEPREFSPREVMNHITANYLPLAVRNASLCQFLETSLQRSGIVVTTYEGQEPTPEDVLITDEVVNKKWQGRAVVTFCRRHIGIPLEKAPGEWVHSVAAPHELPALLARIYLIEMESDDPANALPSTDKAVSDNDDMMILVVDDHPINRRLLADQLGSLGYQCKTANDGVDALNVLNKNHIDIVLSDVNMPNMDGYRLTQRIRQLGLTLPVIGVTANALAEEKQRCLESGMDSCLSKPVTLDVIKQTLTVYAERVRKSRES